MKIFYAVQGTGQGHISRARAMAKAFEQHSVDVDWLFSGREKQKLFDMEPFGAYQHRRGLTFSTVAGSVSYWRTLRDNSFFEFIRDALTLDLRDYDLVVTDYEPVTAWACKLRGIETVGIGHQYAFGSNTPRAGDDALSKLIMNRFAPADIGVGLHWHPYDQHTLPPILDLEPDHETPGEHYLVYLPFEDQSVVTQWLQSQPACRFIQYAPGLNDAEASNVTLHATCIDGFKRDLHRCRGVICNSGFELISECLQLAKPVLTKPLAGQTEQQSNAKALHELGYATTLTSLDSVMLAHWLGTLSSTPQIHFADVAACLAQWLAEGAKSPVKSLADTLWQGSNTPIPTLATLQRQQAGISTTAASLAA